MIVYIFQFLQSKAVRLRLINAHPTEISAGYDKNGRIMAVFGRMDFYYFFGILLFIHSFADSVKRYFCLG